MSRIKIGDYVTRNSYGNDVLFCVVDIIKLKEKNNIAILKGVTLRIEASAYLDDLNKETNEKISRNLQKFEDEVNKITNVLIQKYNLNFNTRKSNYNDKIGLILHLDGDKKYAEKSERVYERFNLNAIVKNIKENRQPLEIINLLNKYNPDIVILTRT